jgi:hypothetical protein
MLHELASDDSQPVPEDDDGVSEFSSEQRMPETHPDVTEEHGAKGAHYIMEETEPIEL